jgi:hypothetical protein
LVKDFPHLKAECLKNAAKSLGPLFGRNLNRNQEDEVVYLTDIVREYPELYQQATELLSTAKIDGTTKAKVEKKLERAQLSTINDIITYLQKNQ